MTREELKLTVSQCVTAKWCQGYNKGIDKAFDDFESRICENCKYFDKYWNKTEEEADGICLHKSNYFVEYCDLDFGCNKFKRKQNDNK